jgi:hypothetical protein
MRYDNEEWEHYRGVVKLAAVVLGGDVVKFSVNVRFGFIDEARRGEIRGYGSS